MTIIEKQNNLFDRWQGDQTQFVRDGLIDEATYMTTNPKVVFALKDDYGPPEDLSNYVRENGAGHTWATVARWCYGLQNLHRDVPWAEVAPYGGNTHSQKRPLLSRVGIMNMKKIPGVNATTDVEAVRTYIKIPENKEFLKEQWSLYSPQLTICAGGLPFDSMRFILDASKNPIQTTLRGQRYWQEKDGRIILESCHPAARYPASVKYYMTIDAAREVLGSTSPSHVT